MSAHPILHSPPLGVWDSLRAEKISVKLKFGLHHTSFEYSTKPGDYPIIDQLYYEAEKWIRRIVSSKHEKSIGRYIMHLYRIQLGDFVMAPVTQASDVEQNSLIEVVLVPVEINENPHRLYECQCNVPTNCSKCTRFIFGVYKQGFRCSKCRMTFHKECAPFFLDDCLVETHGGQNTSGKSTSKKTPLLIIINPFDAETTLSSYETTIDPNLERPNDNIPPNFPEDAQPEIAPNTILDKGIFPASIRNGHSIGRYLFRLTTHTLSMTTNLSRKSIAQTHISPSTDAEIVLSLTDIGDLVLTHFQPNRNDIFEIHLRDKTVIKVGKRTDSDALQMETAQFYSAIRDQRETLINAIPPSPPSLTASPVPGAQVVGTPGANQENRRQLTKTKSNFRVTPGRNGVEGKDLHELYALTGEKIGQGAFGLVRGAYRKSTHEPVAVKIIEKSNCCEKDIQRINEEIAHLCEFNHVNILKLEAYYERADAVYLVTERMETDMCKYIMNSKNHYLDEDTSKILIYQVVVALRYLHDKECGHLDVKCENILLSLLKPIPPTANKSSQNGVDPNRDFPLVKLADFGYSRIIGEHSFRKTRVGTKVYNAPEIYNSKVGYNRLADMWSAGIVLYAALSGSLPFDEKSYSNAKEIVGDEKKLFGSLPWRDVSDMAKNLLKSKLLVVQIDSRSKSSDVLFHDWFTDPQLYKNLREIERRTKYLMSTRQQDITPSSNWLTTQRADLVWTSYQSNFH